MIDTKMVATNINNIVTHTTTKNLYNTVDLQGNFMGKTIVCHNGGRYLILGGHCPFRACDVRLEQRTVKTYLETEEI